MKNLALLFLIFIVLNLFVVAQTADSSRHANFGSSLKKFETTDKNKSKSDKQNANANNSETISIETNLVVNDVLVVNQTGNAILGLKKGDFIISEDEKPQEVEIFSSGENSTIPRSIVLIMDTGFVAKDYINTSIEAAKNLVDKLGFQDEMAIVTSDVKLLADFTSDKTQLKNSLNNFKNNFAVLNYKNFPKANNQEQWKTMMDNVLASDGGRSSEFSSLLATLNEMFDEKNIRPIVILQSNGGELFLLRPIKERFSKNFHERNFGFNEIREAIEKSRVTIYSVIPGLQLVGLTEQQQETNLKIMLKTDLKKNSNDKNSKLEKRMVKIHAEEYLADQTALIEIAKLSGGYADFLAKPEDADSVYSSILTVIKNRYVVGYYATNQARDGKPRNLKIEVRGHPEYIILGRKTYIAPNF